MVKLPLLIGARPMVLASSGCKGPLVPLNKGNWLVTSNHKDSHIFIDCYYVGQPVAPSHQLNGEPLKIIVENRILLQARIEHAGKEESISIYAERQ